MDGLRARPLFAVRQSTRERRKQIMKRPAKIIGIALAAVLAAAAAFLLIPREHGNLYASGEKMAVGGTVSVLAVWGGQELDVFNEMVKPFENETGIQVRYEGTRDINAILTTRVQAGIPPDVAVLPGPGKMAEFARQGYLTDLGTVLNMDQMHKDYAAGWLDMGTVDGSLVGVFMKVAIKGLVWYNPPALDSMGIAIPQTAQQLQAASDKLVSRGVTPWSIGLESGAASGWVGTDWLENIFLRMYGPDKYKDWYEGKLPWTSPELKSVWNAWGRIVADPKMVYGGKRYMLSTNFGQAAAPLFATPPEAYFHMQASFIQGFIREQFPSLEPGKDYNFFGFPPIEPQYAKAIEAGGDLVGLFNDTPQARAFVRYITTPEAQSFWTSGTGALSANRNVSLVFYPDVLSKQAAKILQDAEIVVFDASDMMPGEMNNAFWSAVMSYVENPLNLDGILLQLERVRKRAY
jgi:alpha-glucoside transport system substrate-binding protein